MGDLDAARAFALSLPGASEEPHFEMTSFRVRGKIFATVPPGGEYHENFHQWWGDHVTESNYTIRSRSACSQDRPRTPGPAPPTSRCARSSGTATSPRRWNRSRPPTAGAASPEAQWEAAFARWLPVQTSACRTRLSQFFKQWFDTPYPAGGGKGPAAVTGPGLNGPDFYNARGGCP